ncbi:hypothetical protein ACFVGX_25375 [Streptomyces sp. NPDC127113]|uniref:hypothetical protein n=1 Tax=Streptomyces sp. NPDC127113 TaxID=3345365 RepID=UPI003634ECB4
MKSKKRMATLLASSAILGASIVGANATDANAQPFRCYSWLAHNTSSGVGRLQEDLWLQQGPYADCDEGKYASAADKFYIWCYVNNQYGNVWYYGRREGTDFKGWLYSGDVTIVSGSLYKCS